MFSIGFLTLNIIILLGLLVLFFCITLLRGEHILTRMIATSYPTTLVYMHVPYELPNDLIQIIVYSTLFALVYITFGKYITGRHAYNRIKKIYNAVLLAFATVITIITLYYQVLTLESMYSLLTFSFLAVFTAIPFGVWLIVPLVLIALLNHGYRGS